MLKMRIRNSQPLLFALFASLLLLPALQEAHAQDDPERPVLPDIAPRVVEIRGQLEISMPSLQRQPLVGFNPPPQVAPIPADRRPFVETYKQESVELPPSPLQNPQPPAVASLISRSPRNGILEASAGRYFSRNIQLQTELPLSDPVAMYANLDYDGSDGHEPIEERPEAHASFDAMEAMVGLQHTGSSAAIGVEVDGFFNNYALFAAESVASSGNLSDDPPDREGRGGGLTAWVRTQSASRVDFDGRLRIGTTSYETQPSGASSQANDDFYETRESTLDTEADIRLPLAAGQSLRGHARFTGIGRDEDGFAGTVQMFDGAGGIMLTLGRGIELTALARVMTFAADDHKPLESGDSVGGDSQTHISADVLANVYPGGGLRLYVQNRPHAEHHMLNSMHRTNPYVVDAPIIQPTIYTINARGGAHLVQGAFEVDLYGGYQLAPNFLYFARADDDEAYGYGSDLLATRYDEAEIIVFGGDVSVNLPAGLNAAIGLAVRDGELVDDEVDIPYFGPLFGYGSISLSFADGRAFVQATSRYESARYVDAARSRKLGDFFDLDLEGSYDITPSLGVVARFQNLSADFLERWEGYPQSSFVLMGGARVRW